MDYTQVESQFYNNRQGQIDLIKFAVKYPGWHTLATDSDTVEVVCATQNLGIISVNDYCQFSLRSPEKARQFLAARDS